MKINAFFLFVLFSFSAVTTAQVSNWKNHTDMKDVRSVTVSENNIWAATSGGAFVYNLENKTFRKFHKADGFSGSQLTSVASDNEGRIWFGSNTGRIDIYDPQTNSFTAILDIFNSLKQQKDITDISILGDSVFITTGFGISIIDPSTLIFVDTYSRFATLNSDLRVHNLIKTDRIYAALDNGLAVQKPGTVNLSSPDSWNVYPLFQGTLRKIKEVIEYNGMILVGSDHGIYHFNGISFTPFLLQGSNIRKIKVIENILYISSGNSLYRFSGELSAFITYNRIYHDIILTDGAIHAATDDGIIKINETSPGEFDIVILKPDAPNANLFAGLAVDSRGYLWSASARDPNGRGIYMFNGDIWTNFNAANNPEIIYDAYFNVFSSGEEVYLGNWGRGFLRIRNGVMQNFNYHNSPLRGTSKDPEYIVIGGLGKDSKNNLWILNYEAVTRENLSMLTPDSTWYHFKVGGMQDLLLDENFGLVIDNYDTKWFYSRSKIRSGLFYFNENSTYTNSSDDRSGFISGLNESVLSLAVDKRGDIWIGTALGVNIITNASAAATSANPQFRISQVFSLRQYSINCIAVDPLNRKWIGTNQGLLLVNSDGSALIASFNARNTPLLSDEIRSLVVDEQSGIVYAGTDAGLTSFETFAKKPLQAFEQLNVYPNPLKINNHFNGTVTIDGLIKDTDIKILNINGKLIQEFSSPGGRVAFWNGKDSEGEFVSSGIYIIVASDREGDNVKTAKIAVLKE
jgi:ligand-binding sensor domain-containing protein